MKYSILQRMATLLAFILIIPLTVLSITACINKYNQPEDDDTEINNPIDPDDGNNENQKEIIQGIYRFENNVSFDNTVYFVSDNELYDFFKTNDINGVKKSVLSNGFDSFTENITSFEGSSKFIEFSSNFKVSSYIYKNGNFILVNNNEFTYSYEDNKFVSEGINPIISNNAEEKKITLYYPFYYEENDELVLTPLYVKATLTYYTYSYESVNNDNSFIYTYEENSCKLVYDFDKNIDFDSVTKKLQSMFNIESSDDVLSEIENLISKFDISFNSNFSIATFFNNDDGLTFSYHTITDLSFVAFNDVKVIIINKSIGLNQLSNELELNIQVNADVTLKYNIVLV